MRRYCCVLSLLVSLSLFAEEDPAAAQGASTAPASIDLKDGQKRKLAEAKREAAATEAKVKELESQLRAFENTKKLNAEKNKLDKTNLERISRVREMLWDTRVKLVSSRFEEKRAQILIDAPDANAATLLVTDAENARQNEAEELAANLVGEIEAALNEARQDQQNAHSTSNELESRNKMLDDDIKRRASNIASLEQSIQSSKSGVQSLVDQSNRERAELVKLQKEQQEVVTGLAQAKVLNEVATANVKALERRALETRAKASAAVRENRATGRGLPTYAGGRSSTPYSGGSQAGQQDVVAAKLAMEAAKAKAEAEEKAKLEAENKAKVEQARKNDADNAITYVMKDGKRYKAVKTIDAGDVLAVKADEGKMVTLKKQEIVEKIEPVAKD